MKTKKSLKNTPDVVSGGIATFSIIVNGNRLPETVSVMSVRIEKKVNNIAEAMIVIADGDPNEGTFPLSSSDLFIPRSEIVIQAGYDSGMHPIFKGVIVSQSPRVDKIGSTLEVFCKDEAVRINIARKSRSFSKMSDSSIITSIIREYTGITGNVTELVTTYPEQVQKYATDWEFILARAEANGMIVTAFDSTVSVFRPAATGTSSFAVTYGDSLMEFSGDWHLWEESGITITDLSRKQGKATCAGTNAANPGAYMTLAGLGIRFDGDHFISGVVHTISGGTWTSEVSFGLAPLRPAEAAAEHGRGILPTARGLYIAKVLKLGGDPDGEYRILVDVPLLDMFSAGVWARLSNFYASAGSGAFFLPGVGDEVVLGFLNEDPRYPIILGSMYNTAAHLPYHDNVDASGLNPLKAIVSKSGMSVLFDDEKQALSLTTPQNNMVTISDKDKQISIIDEHANSIIMSEDGITIISSKDINIIAGGSITLDAVGNISTASKADVRVTALNITETANVGYTAKGAATAELSASGQVTVKGAMVMIN